MKLSPFFLIALRSVCSSIPTVARASEPLSRFGAEWIIKAQEDCKAAQAADFRTFLKSSEAIEEHINYKNERRILQPRIETLTPVRRSGRLLVAIGVKSSATA